MSNKEVCTTINQLVMAFLNELDNNYWEPLYQYVKDNPDLIKTVPGFLLDHQEIVVYVGRTHIAVEYLGSESLVELKQGSELTVQIRDYLSKNCNLFEQIIGFKYDSTAKSTMPLLPFNEDLLFPTNRGLEKLLELGWNFHAQNSVIGLNTPALKPVVGEFARVVNGMFFDADESGLKSRRIKWLDFFPIHFNDSGEVSDTISFNLRYMKMAVEDDAQYLYPIPADYKYVQLPKINQFIEIWGDNTKSETDITSYLAKKENEFILTMKFGAKEVHPEIVCEWQSEYRENIKPDFFVVQPNGYADIVEFKLPDIKKKAVVGGNNREAFAAWLNSYISQTRVYSSYFDDPNNRKWFEERYGFKVHKPRRWLVVGRRFDFDSDVWREIMSDYKDLEIITFDDLIDGVVVQFYK
ncbi:MAG: Shedu anti-phage system protein SduA domain-containing protein [Deferribacterales bacterium]